MDAGLVISFISTLYSINTNVHRKRWGEGIQCDLNPSPSMCYRRGVVGHEVIRIYFYGYEIFGLWKIINFYNLRDRLSVSSFKLLKISVEKF
jgi:hypothetical protein